MMRGNQTCFYHQTWFIVNKYCMRGAVKLQVVTETPIQSFTYWTFPQFTLFFFYCSPNLCQYFIIPSGKISRAPLLVSNLLANFANFFTGVSRGQLKLMTQPLLFGQKRKRVMTFFNNNRTFFSRKKYQFIVFVLYSYFTQKPIRWKI